MRKALGLRWVVVTVGAVMLMLLAAACTREVVKEVPVEVEKVVTMEVVKEVKVPGETVVVEKVVTKEVKVPGETMVVTKEVVKQVEVPGETVVVEKVVTKEVKVPGETMVVTKEVVKEVKVPGETVVVTKEVPIEKIVEKIVTKQIEVRPAGMVTPSGTVRVALGRGILPRDGPAQVGHGLSPDAGMDRRLRGPALPELRGIRRPASGGGLGAVRRSEDVHLPGPRGHPVPWRLG